MTRTRILALAGAGVIVLVVVGVLMARVFLAPQPAFASTTTLSILKGAVLVQRAGATDFVPAKDGLKMLATETLRGCS